MSTSSSFQDFLTSLRRELHQHPELSGKEQWTAKRVQEELRELGISFEANIAGHGIIAEIPGQQDGPCIALRSDMDALPIDEETGLPFSSSQPGVMHACGHDGHMTALIGAARLLTEGPPPALPVRLLFQPAEEIAEGAKALIAAGALDGVACIFGVHVDRHYGTGTLVVHEGAVNASSDSFTIEISGQSGHGARPHETTDAVVVGSLMVMALQTLVSREVDPAFPSVLSVGEFRAGTAANVIAGTAYLSGTIRTQHLDVRKHLIEGLQRIAKSIGELHGATVQTTITDGTPPVVNQSKPFALAKEAAIAVVGKDRVKGLRVANMGGEDFGYYLERVPGCFIRFGAQVLGRESYPAHSSRFDFDEASLPIVAQYLSTVARLAGENVRRDPSCI